MPDLESLPIAERQERLGGLRRVVPGMAQSAPATTLELAAQGDEPWDPITVHTAFDLLLSNGLRPHFDVGSCMVPHSLTEHWYLRQHAVPGEHDLSDTKPEYEFPATGLHHPDRPDPDALETGAQSSKRDDDQGQATGPDRTTDRAQPGSQAAAPPRPQQPAAQPQPAAQQPAKPPAS